MDTPADAQVWVGIGTAIGAAVAFLVRYFTRRPQEPKEEPPQASVRGAAIMDSSFGERLVTAIEAQTVEMMTSRLAAEKLAKEAADLGLKTVAVLERLGKGMEEVSQEIKEHRNEMRHHGDKLPKR